MLLTKEENVKLQVYKEKVLEVLKGLDTDTGQRLLQSLSFEIGENALKSIIL